MKTPDEVAGIADPQQRLKVAHTLVDEYTEAIQQLSQIRRAAIRDLMADGIKQAQVAKILGLTSSRVSQLLKADAPPAEQAFFGKGSILIAIGAKKEADKTTDPGDMVSFESFSAFEELAEAARGVGLGAAYEVIPPPGLVELNRANLVVLTNPRLLPFLSQVMGADPCLRYVYDNDRWFIRDVQAGVDYTSPRDNGESADYGYVGRLPRPDGSGTFLYCAGTHAPGTWAAARYLATEFADLYKDLKTRRFSTVVKCTFRPEYDRKLLTVERVAPLYRHES